MKIVVVDDQEDMVFIVKSILSNKGYEVQTDSAGTLLDHIDQVRPDLVILDINLGEWDGGEICRKLKERLTTKHIPIILMSAVPEIAKISRECGAEDYLPKPFQISDLVRKVEQNLQAA